MMAERRSGAPMNLIGISEYDKYGIQIVKRIMYRALKGDRHIWYKHLPPPKLSTINTSPNNI